MQNVMQKLLFLVLSLALTSQLAGQTTVTLVNGENNATPYDTTGNDVTLDIDSGTATQSGILSGSGDVSKTGDGTVQLNAINTYSGSTDVQAGTLSLLNDGARLIGTTGISVGDSAEAALIVSGEAFVFNEAALILGNTSIGVGSVTLADLNDDFGVTMVNVGEIVVGNAGSGTMNISSDAFLFSGGDIRLGADTGGSGEMTLDAGLLTGFAALKIAEAADSTATVTIANGGAAGFERGVEIATAAGSTGVLNILSGGALFTKDSVSGDALRAGDGTATVTIDGGTLGTTAGPLTTSVPITIGGNATFRTGSEGSITLNGVISGDGTLVKDSSSTGPHTLTLSAENTYTGGTIISAGTVIIAADSALGAVPGVATAGNLTLNGGTLATTASFTLNANRGITVGASGGGIHTAAATALTYGGTIDGEGAFTKAGDGDLILTADHAHAGGTTVSAGTLTLGTGGATGSVSGDIANNGTVVFNRSGDRTYDGVVSGIGDVVHNGNILRLSSAQTYTGATSINSGFLVLPTDVDQALAASTAVHIASGATLDISDRNLTIAGLTGDGQVYSFGGSDGNLTVNTAADQSQTFSGTLGSTYADFSLTKTGAGTLTFSGANTYTGTTTISDGTLIINGSTAASLIDVGTGGTLGGVGVIGGATTVEGTLAPGLSPGTLQFSDNLTLLSTATLSMEITGIGAGEFDILNGSGTNTLNLDGILALDNTAYTATLGDTITIFTNWDAIAGTFDSIIGNDLGGGLMWDTGSLYTLGSLTVVPEPSTAALLAVTLAAFAMLRRSRLGGWTDREPCSALDTVHPDQKSRGVKPSA